MIILLLVCLVASAGKDPISLVLGENPEHGFQELLSWWTCSDQDLVKRRSLLGKTALDQALEKERALLFKHNGDMESLKILFARLRAEVTRCFYKRHHQLFADNVWAQNSSGLVVEQKIEEKEIAEKLKADWVQAQRKMQRQSRGQNSDR